MQVMSRVVKSPEGPWERSRTCPRAKEKEERVAPLRGARGRGAGSCAPRTVESILQVMSRVVKSPEGLRKRPSICSRAKGKEESCGAYSDWLHPSYSMTMLVLMSVNLLASCLGTRTSS